MTFCIVQRTKFRRSFPFLGVRYEHRTGTFTLSTDHTTHGYNPSLKNKHGVLYKNWASTGTVLSLARYVHPFLIKIYYLYYDYFRFYKLLVKTTYIHRGPLLKELVLSSFLTICQKCESVKDIVIVTRRKKWECERRDNACGICIFILVA